MGLTEILIAVVAGVLANLLTPSVRNTGARVAAVTAVRLRAFGRKATETRLRQLQEERSEIETLFSNPKVLANRIAYYTFPQVIGLWIALFALLVTQLIFNIDIFHSPWVGGIAGVIGYATRYPVGALVAISDLVKINNIERFRTKNMAAQTKLKALLGPKKRANKALLPTSALTRRRGRA